MGTSTILNGLRLGALAEMNGFGKKWQTEFNGDEHCDDNEIAPIVLMTMMSPTRTQTHWQQMADGANISQSIYLY